MAIARVYRNLNNGLWSIKQRANGKWIVVGHCESCALEGVSTYISDARHDFVRSGHYREVFAWLVGDLVSVNGFVSYKGREALTTGGQPSTPFNKTSAITFHPFSEVKQGFIYRDGGDYTGSQSAYFTANSGVWA